MNVTYLILNSQIINKNEWQSKYENEIKYEG